ncbi:DUF488 family protein [Brevundimonas sp.]|uniref:DUF488 domain-containing protein n=1 Tax=Brevundimonas sp. TaxID=1871086 RepID=UPI0025D59BA5|nr:DUF488 domain-containing protein [Brevundimonas sp.]
MKLATIGYESEPQGAVIARLKAAGVERVIDVRAVAASRRAGFSKTVLGNSLNEAGIEYLHLRALGTPAAGRQAARAGRHGEMQAIFADHMREPEAQLALRQAVDLAREKKSALLCYEANPAECHRTLVAEMMLALEAFEIEHL